MTLRDLIFIAFGIVVGVVIVVLINGQQIELDPDTVVTPMSCDNSDRFNEFNKDGFVIIETEQRNNLINNFIASRNAPESGGEPVIQHPTDGSTTNVTQSTTQFPPYGFISKRALDNIFNNDLNVNGVKCYIGLDGDNIKLMISGGRCNEVNGPAIPAGADATVLVTSYCPTICN